MITVKISAGKIYVTVGQSIEIVTDSLLKVDVLRELMKVSR